MENTNVQLLVILIILAAIGGFVIRFVIQKKKRVELLTKSAKDYEELKKVCDDINAGLERAEQISKTNDAIKLFNNSYKNYKDLEVELADFDTDYKEMENLAKKGKHKDFLASNKSINFKLDALKEKSAAQYKLVFNYTSYELENTSMALDLKESFKEVQNGFEVNLAYKEIYTKSFEDECDHVEYEFTRFEDQQKLGEYTKARKHLKNATDFINKLEHNYVIITNIINLCQQLEKNIEIIDQVSQHISDRKFKLDQDEYLKNYDELKVRKATIEEELEQTNFADKITDEFVAEKETELTELQEAIFNIKTSIEEQYSQIKIIEELIKTNEELLAQSDELVVGALEERDEINKLYQMPENKAIQKLETEVKTYEKFKKDYEVLLDLVYDLKESYDSLVARVTKSNEFIKHFMNNMQLAIVGLGEIRSDEIKALEHIDEYKREITIIEMYLSNNEHLHQLSNQTEAKLSEAYTKIENLSLLLDESPLNISDVRKLTVASESLLAELKKTAEKEIQDKANSESLIRFTNRYVEDTKSQDILSHAMTLYNNRSYQAVIKEVRQFIYREFENADLLYKQIIENTKYKTIKQFTEEM